MDNKTCCLTGHRPMGFPWDYNNKICDEHQEYLYVLQQTIIKLITEYGYTHFISGGAIGADQGFAELVLDLRDTRFSHITLEIAIPCPKQDLKWSPVDKERYKMILERCDKKELISQQYTYDCMQVRNRYMVDNSDFVIAVWNREGRGGTFNTIQYAKLKNKPIKYIYLR